MERVEFGNGLHAIHLGQKFNIDDATMDVTPKADISPGSEDSAF